MKIIIILSVIVPLLLIVAFLTLAERKVIGSIQRRVGPNKVGFYGILQPFADALKLILKESVYPAHSNKIVFIIAPIASLIVSLIAWSVIPFGSGLYISDIYLGILFLLAISSLGVYGIVFAGWSANSKYAFLGSLRSTASIISYELVIGLLILIVIILIGSLNLTHIIEYQKAVWY
jgi:NADH-ubiquinone oxidoreductase chain 1